MTFHFESGSHPNKCGNYTIYLSISHSGERKRVKTSINVPIKCWDAGTERVRRSWPAYKQDNEELQLLMDKARGIERELKSQDRLTMLHFFNRFLGKELPYMLLSYFHHIREIQIRGLYQQAHRIYTDSGG